MKTKNWITGLLGGLALGLVVASIMTWLDWRLNPGGIFFSREQGTHWPVVWETWSSWFWPVAWLGLALWLVTLYLIAGLRK